MSNLRLNAPDPESFREASNDTSHIQSDSDNSQDDLETSEALSFGWKLKDQLYFASTQWSARKTPEHEVQAAVEKQYLPIVFVPGLHMAIFCNSAAGPHRKFNC